MKGQSAGNTQYGSGGQPKRRLINRFNRPYQFKLLVWSNVVAVVMLGCVYAAISYFFWHMQQRGVTEGLPEGHVFFRYINEQLTTMTEIFFISSGVILSGVSVFCLFYSHKVLGPLYRLNKHLTEIAEGKEPSPLHLRQGDYFQGIAKAYNKQLDATHKSSGRNDTKKGA